MRLNKIKLLVVVCLLFSGNVQAEEHQPPNIQPYEIPTFTGAPVDYKQIKPAIDPKKKINGDAIFQWFGQF